MKDVIKAVPRENTYTVRELATAVLGHTLAAVVGLIAARAEVADRLLPFGTAFAAGCPAVFAPAAAAGAFIGYFIPIAEGNAFRCIAALFAVVGLRLTASVFEKTAKSPITPAVICFISSLLTSLLALGLTEGSMVGALAEALLSAGGAYFIACFFNRPREGVGLSPEGLASLFAMLGIILTGLCGLEAYGISVGRIAGLALILCAAKYGGVISGSICGITVSTALLLSGTGEGISVIYAFAGLAAGVFSFFGKYALLLLPPLFALFGGMLTSSAVTVAAAATEALIGSALFLCVSGRAGTSLGRLFSLSRASAIPTGVKKSLEMRLNMAANALCDVSETVEQVAGELSKINAPDFGSVISAVEQDACVGCKLRLHCWESRREDTVAALLEITKAVKSGGSDLLSGLPEEFKGRCARLPRIAASASKRYSEYTSHIAAENRIEEVRSVVSDQFEGISDMLYELAEDLENDSHYDNTIAERAVEALKNLNIRAEEYSSRTDKFGRVKIELKLKKEGAPVLNRLQIMRLLSVACERDFDVPAVTEAGGEIFITASERAVFRVDLGVEQRCASGSAICGDAYRYFFDGRGHFIAVLSDGMGTGGRAAVDGAMASGLMSRLIKAGFGFDSSLKILNSSMLFKSTDESLATVDIACIDLYTGLTELYKAGAAPTVIRRSGKTGRAESSSMPAGILREVRFDRASIKCREGDIVVMLSDGATTEGCDWIRDELEAWENGTAQELSERICEGAHRRRSDSHEDDITVIAAILKRA